MYYSWVFIKSSYLCINEEYNENNFRDLYLSCNDHFSEIGNQVSSDIIYKYLQSSSKIY